MRVGVAGIGLLLCAGLLAATITTETVDAQSDPIATLRVDINGNAFSPPDIIVLKGSRVTWTNKDSIVHTVTSDSGSSESLNEVFAPAPASPGAVQDHTFNNLGLFRYHCEVHPTMRGSVQVVEKFDAVAMPIVPVAADDASQFLPKQVALNVSQGIRWSNDGMNVHAVTFEDPDIGALGDLKPGSSLTFNFTKEGTFAYRCKYHSSDFRSGMIGHVAVGRNATLPVVIGILFPPNNSNITGNFSVAGTVDTGPGNPTVTRVEIGFDDEPNWTAARGTTSWSIDWDSRLLSNGNHTLRARAIAGEDPVAETGHAIIVKNAVAAAEPTGGSGTPGPLFFVAVLALVWAAANRRQG